MLKPLIDRAVPEWKKDQQALEQRFKREVARAIADHHAYVSNWCQEAHDRFLVGVPADGPTIGLSFKEVPRRLGVGGTELDEVDLLTTDSQVAVLGDPGAGKTTTLRRLARWVALESSVGKGDDSKYVVVVVCRDEEWGSGKNALCKILGNKIGVTGKLFADVDQPESRIREVLEVGALVLIDGLDEVPAHVRDGIERDIVNLGRHFRCAKVILSCRSGAYIAPLPGFETAEIRPLTPDQIRRVVDSLLRPEEALAFDQNFASSTHPASDLANRPLFLIYMLAIFKRRGTIPDRPIDLYEAVIRLIIQEWDEQRGIRRMSRYAEFGVEDKRRFLADLAYELIRRNHFRFDEKELADVYVGLAERYGLPKSEARRVARELESHTGLIVDSGEQYEFSHLSLQEFLAADSMVRGAASARIDWWLIHPEMAAVAVAMSSDANRWFGDLMTRLPAKDLEDVRGIHVFLYRLARERPRFVRSRILGRAILQILFRARITDPVVVAGLYDLKAVRDSVVDALAEFDAHASGNSVRLVLYAHRSATPSEALAISSTVLKALVGDERLRQALRSARTGSRSRKR